MDGKLNTNYTLDYAVQMGWNIDDAIAVQLSLYKPGSHFDIEGKYMDTEGTFCILRDTVDSGFYKIMFEITSEDTVKLGTDLIPVKMVWEEKPITSPSLEPVQEGGQIATESNSSMEPNTVYTAEDTVKETDMSVPEEEGIVDQSATVKENTPEEAKEEASAPEAVEKSAAENKQEAEDEPKKEEEEETSQPEGNESNEDEGEDEGETNVETSFALLTEKVASLEQALQESKATIAGLEKSLAEYAAKEQESIKLAKENMFIQYASLLSASEIEDIKGKSEDYTLDQLEATLAITYARNCQKTAPQQTVQVNVESFNTHNEVLPDFMTRAMEFDKKKNLGF